MVKHHLIGLELQLVCKTYFFIKVLSLAAIFLKQRDWIPLIVLGQMVVSLLIIHQNYLAKSPGLWITVAVHCTLLTKIWEFPISSQS